MKLDKLYYVLEKEYLPIYRIPLGTYIEWYTDKKWHSEIANLAKQYNCVVQDDHDYHSNILAKPLEIPA